MNFLFNLSNRKKLLFFILSILCGFLDYLICDLVAWVNHLPLFCDTIFIMALSFFAGPWWGVLAGFFYHLIDFALHHTMELGHLFMLCHFLERHFQIRQISVCPTWLRHYICCIEVSSYRRIFLNINKALNL